jgi:hypothetical protein
MTEQFAHAADPAPDAATTVDAARVLARALGTASADIEPDPGAEAH